MIPAYLYLNCSKVDFLFSIHLVFLFSLPSPAPFLPFIKFNAPILLTSHCPLLLTPHLALSRPGRAFLHGKSSLRIENVRSDDQGWYECKVLMLEQQYDTFHNGSWVHLTVNGKSHIILTTMQCFGVNFNRPRTYMFNILAKCLLYQSSMTLSRDLSM